MAIYVSRSGLTRCRRCDGHIHLQERPSLTRCPFCAAVLAEAHASPPATPPLFERAGRRGGVLASALLGAVLVAPLASGCEKKPAPVDETVDAEEQIQENPYGEPPNEEIAAPPIDDDDGAADTAEAATPAYGLAPDDDEGVEPPVEGELAPGEPGPGETTAPPADGPAPTDADPVPVPAEDDTTDDDDDADAEPEIRPAVRPPAMPKYGLPPRPDDKPLDLGK